MARDMNFGLVRQVKAWYVPVRFGEVRNLWLCKARLARLGMVRQGFYGELRLVGFRQGLAT